MKKEDLFELLSDIDEKSVQEAQDFSVKKTPLWKGRSEEHTSELQSPQ